LNMDNSREIDGHLRTHARALIYVGSFMTMVSFPEEGQAS
jgi:hypothetical protein